MIIALLYGIIEFVVIDVVFAALPLVIALPFGIDGFVIQSVAQFNDFVAVAWPLLPIWHCLIFYFAFKISMVSLRIVLGNRVPDQS